MSFAVPAALFLTALALPIIALYVLKVRLRRVPVSTNLFWKQVYEEKPPRSWWQQLRHLLSLLAQLTLLLLLVLAIADPYFSWQALQARRLVIVLDTSASMQSTDVTPSRFEAARAAAHDVVDGLRFRDQVAIISAGSRPEVVLGMAGHVPTLRRALDSVQPTDTPASLKAATDLAKQLIGDHPHGQILVLTDGCADRADPSMVTTNLLATDELSADESGSVDPATSASDRPGHLLSNAAGDEAIVESGSAEHEIDVQYRVFATEASNIGITQFQARRSLIDPIGYEILVTVRNASDIALKGRLELELDDIPIDVVPFSLQPDESWTRSIEKTSLEGGLLKASLTQVASGTMVNSDAESQGDASMETTRASSNVDLNVLPTDDMAWAIVPPRVVQNVSIISPGNLFLQKVFEANPLVSVTVNNELPTSWQAETIFVFHRLVPEVLPPGDVLIVDPETSCNLWDVGDVIENPIVTEQDEASPLMTHIRMDNVLMPEAKRLEFKAPIHKLAATLTGEPVYARITRPNGRCLVLSVNLERSDLAFRTAFPILITNALSWFAGQPGELQPSLSTGQLTLLDESIGEGSVLSASLPVSGEHADDVSEEGADTSVSARQQRCLISPSGEKSQLLSYQIGPLNKTGVWRVSEDEINLRSGDGSDTNVGGNVLQQFAVNLANASETDLRPVEGLASAASESSAAGAWLTRPVWFYLIVVASLFLVLEWFLYQRRFIT